MAGSPQEIQATTRSADGYYSQHTAGAASVLNRLGEIALPHFFATQQSPPLQLLDLGSADGGTSHALFQQLLTGVTVRPITLTYNDLPSNNYTALFRQAQSFGKHREVFVNASGRSFFEPLLPPNTVDLTTCATSSHWLSVALPPVSQHVHIVRMSQDTQEWHAYARQSAADWQRFLELRATELKRGGILAVANLCRDDESGRHLGPIGGKAFFDEFNHLWRHQVSEAEHERTCFPQFYRSESEVVQPLLDCTSAAYSNGLRLEKVSTEVLRCPCAAAFAQHRDVDLFVRQYIPNLRSWSESVFRQALDSGRSEEEKDAIIDRFYASYGERVRDEPDAHGLDYVSTFLIARKI